MSKTIITSALPYVNNIPHLGTMVCIISADVYARYLRLKGRDVISVLGTDEHGTTAETKALEEGITPRQLVDKYFKIHTDIYRWFGCSFDCYGRSSSESNHLTSIEIFEALKKNGFVFELEVEQMYCDSCRRFLADRFIEGKCPYCGYDDARGDQCDSCGKLINATELKNPRCKICSKAPVARKTVHLFIDLPKLAPKLKEWFEQEKNNWSQNARTMTESWLNEGLKPRAITRDIKWGIPVPGYPEKVFYSWFDAPIAYISITREVRKDWEGYWKNPGSQLVQFMGKDNIPFHTILFPSFLMGSGLGYVLLKKLSVNEYLNYEGGKFSKSRNIGIFGDDAMNSGICSDCFRYYLMVNRPEKADSEFIWKDFQEKMNNELVANIGNFVNRVLTFIDRFYAGIIPEGQPDHEFAARIAQKISQIEQLLDSLQLKDALREIMALSKIGNQYFQEHEPWKQFKDSPKDAADSIYNLVNLVKTLAVLVEPYMPETSDRIFQMLAIERCAWKDIDARLQASHKLGKPSALFKKLEDKEIAALQAKYAGAAKEFMLDLRVGKILTIDEHPNADKLIILQIDLGTEKRQIVAGLRPYYSKDDLLGKHVIIVTNLMIAQLRGYESNGMLLAADDGKHVKVIIMDKSQPGEKVRPEGYSVSEQVITIDKFRTVPLKVADNKVMFKDSVLKSQNQEARVDISDNAVVR